MNIHCLFRLFFIYHVFPTVIIEPSRAVRKNVQLLDGEGDLIFIVVKQAGFNINQTK